MIGGSNPIIAFNNSNFKISTKLGFVDYFKLIYSIDKVTNITENSHNNKFILLEEEQNILE
jgi:hypothetical protein